MQPRLALLHALIFFATHLQVNAANFTFSFGTPTQCDNFPISWSGGTPPFQLVLAPEFGTPRAFDVPASSFNNGQGSYQAQIPFKRGQTFLAFLSDASGFASGGISDVLTVGAQTGSNSCNVTDPGVDFFFQLNSALQQCATYTFSGYDKAAQPVTIFGLVPGGESIILQPPVGPDSFDWIADVASGTSLMFIMTDSLGHKGGSSDVRMVAISGDTTCLNANSPVSLSNAPSATASLSSTSNPSQTSSSTATSSSTSLSANGGSTKKTDTGVIVGAVLAGIFGLCTVAALVLFIIRRRRQSDPRYDGVTSYGSRRTGRMNSVDLDPPLTMGEMQGSQVPVIHPFPYVPPSIPPTATHYSSPSSHNLLSGDSQYDSHTQYTSLTNPHSVALSVPSEYSSYTTQPTVPSPVAGVAITARSSTTEAGRRASMSSAARQKAAMAGSSSNRPTRFILHTDLEEVVPDDEGQEVVELPPQYSEHRAPIAGVSEGSIYSSDVSSAPHPLDHQRGESDAGLQRPIVPTSPTSPLPPAGRRTNDYPRS